MRYGMAVPCIPNMTYRYHIIIASPRASALVGWAELHNLFPPF